MVHLLSKEKRKSDFSPLAFQILLSCWNLTYCTESGSLCDVLFQEFMLRVLCGFLSYRFTNDDAIFYISICFDFVWFDDQISSGQPRIFSGHV